MDEEVFDFVCKGTFSPDSNPCIFSAWLFSYSLYAVISDVKV